MICVREKAIHQLMKALLGWPNMKASWGCHDNHMVAALLLYSLMASLWMVRNRPFTKPSVSGVLALGQDEHEAALQEHQGSLSPPPLVPHCCIMSWNPWERKGEGLIDSASTWTAKKWTTSRSAPFMISVSGRSTLKGLNVIVYERSCVLSEKTVMKDTEGD